MTPQLAYSLRRVAVMIVLSALGVLGAEQTNLVNAAGLDPAIWGGIIAAVLSSAVRAVEGVRDGNRAKTGDVIKEDVRPFPTVA
jgi:hypothetical protein